LLQHLFPHVLAPLVNLVHKALPARLALPAHKVSPAHLPWLPI
jgi:hypothetical protein